MSEATIRGRRGRLVIRNEQVKEMGDLLFAHAMRSRLRRRHADRVGDMSDELLLERILVGMKRARARGFDDWRDIGSFIRAMFIVAPRFDEQQMLREVLTDDEIPPDRRWRQLLVLPIPEDWDDARANFRDWPSP